MYTAEASIMRMLPAGDCDARGPQDFEQAHLLGVLAGSNPRCLGQGGLSNHAGTMVVRSLCSYTGVVHPNMRPQVTCT